MMGTSCPDDANFQVGRGGDGMGGWGDGEMGRWGDGFWGCP
uniref:Uncharacterized protein n=1 Tax=Desertifilum tharense IPPAS B-1220 TaxID=1781255 RepID=A0ACD5GTR7_9CYAN